MTAVETRVVVRKPKTDSAPKAQVGFPVITASGEKFSTLKTPEGFAEKVADLIAKTTTVDELDALMANNSAIVEELGEDLKGRLYEAAEASEGRLGGRIAA